MKLLLTGAFSTGKTTTAKLLIEKLMPEFGLATEVARRCPLPLNEGQTISTTIWLLCHQIAQEIELENASVRNILCDRGIPDIMSHHFSLRGSNDLPPPYLSVAKHWCKSYTKVLFCPIDPNIPPHSDGLRSTSAAYRTMMENTLLETLRTLALDYVTLPTDPENRVVFILNLLAAER